MASGNVQRWEQSMRYAFRGTALLFLLLGNTPPDQKPGDIIVTAPARVPKELKKQTLNFVRTVSDTAEQTQFSRRVDPFCIKITGIDLAYHDLIRKKNSGSSKSSESTQRGTRRMSAQYTRYLFNGWRCADAGFETQISLHNQRAVNPKD